MKPRLFEPRYENRIFEYTKTKRQFSFVVTAKLISAFVFATQIVQSLYHLNTKLQACTAWFVSDLVGNPDNRFSHNEANLDRHVTSYNNANRVNHEMLRDNRQLFLIYTDCMIIYMYI